jgi:thymidylate synthase
MFQETDMHQYFDLVNYVINHGERRQNRTGIDTLSTFGYMFQHNLADGFPLLTSKKMDLEKIAGELRWFLDGNTKPSELNSKIWDAWSYEDNIGPMYGSIWRSYPLER